MDAILDDWVDIRDVATAAVGATVATEVESKDMEPKLGNGNGGELEDPAALRGVAVNHGNQADDLSFL